MIRGQRLLVVQYAGDYRETWWRLRSGGGESYFAQAYSDTAIARLASKDAPVTVVIGVTAQRYREVLAEGLTAIGLGHAHAGVAETDVVEVAREFKPTHLLLRAPMRQVLEWACRSQVRTLLTLADSFQDGFRGWLHTRRLVRLFNHPSVEWVANHGLPATRGLVRMGVAASKVIAWDWPHHNTPFERPAKVLRDGQITWKLIYVGATVEAKGTGDAIRAVAALAGRGWDVRLDIYGDGDDLRPLVKGLEIERIVTFHGRIANSTVIAAMEAADAVLVPSRRSYPEGFPLTVYEALCSRTPIVASDHPMLVEKLRPDSSAIIFKAGDFNGLAAAIERLFHSPHLYAQLSEAAAKTWSALQLPVKWADLVTAWIEGTDANRRWLQEHAWENEGDLH